MRPHLAVGLPLNTAPKTTEVLRDAQYTQASVFRDIFRFLPRSCGVSRRAPELATDVIAFTFVAQGIEYTAGPGAHEATRMTDQLPPAVPATSLIAARLPTRLLLTYVLIVLTAVACWPASASLYRYWTDVQDLGGTHGLLLLATSLYLVFRSRVALATPAAEPSVLGFVLLGIALLAWAILLRAGIEDLQLLVVPALLWLAIFAALGWQAGRPLLVPIGLLLMALPGWGHLATSLQFLTTRAVGLMTAVAGIPVSIERNFVTIPEGVFEVAGGCSGVHFLVVGIALAAVLGELTDASLKRRAKLLVSVIAVALLANWVRVFSIVVAGHLTNMQHSLITHGHYWFGWMLFAVSISAYVWIAGRSDPPPREVQPPTNLPSAARPLGVVGVALLIVGLPGLIYLVDLAAPPANREASVQLPNGRGPWTGPMPTLDASWTPQFPGASAQSQAAYQNSQGDTLEMSRVVLFSQQQGAELVGEANKLFGSVQVSVQSEQIVTNAAGRYREAVIKDAAGARYVVWSVYDIGGHQFVNPLLSQLWYGARSLIGAPTSALVAVRARCKSSCDEGRAQLESFLASMSIDVLSGLHAFADKPEAPPSRWKAAHGPRSMSVR